MHSIPERRFNLPHSIAARSAYAALAVMGLCATALGADKPPLAPDTVAPFRTDSRISATIEFGLGTLASDIEAYIPRRLASIDERVSCVHRRVLFFRVNANCDIWGYVERTGGVSLYGRGDRVYGSLQIHGEIEGQGANRFTSRIHGETEASATIEVEARPELTRDWSLELNLSDNFHWSEPPVLQVMGREIALSKYAEPVMHTQLARLRERVAAAARRLDLHDKAETAWRHAFEPIQLADTPQVWLQLTPQTMSFAGVRANGRVLSGALELAGSAETVMGQEPAAVTPPPLPPLSREVSAPGTFDVLLPVHIGYDAIRDRMKQLIATLPAVAGLSISDVDVYPSSGKLVIGLQIGKTNDGAAKPPRWIYLAAALQVDADGHAIRLADVGVTTGDDELSTLIAPVVAQLRNADLDHGVAYQNLLAAANEKLTRPLKDGFRMEGHLDSAKLEQAYLPADGLTIAFRASGELKIVKGM